MESGIRSIFLMAAGAALLHGAPAVAQDAAGTDAPPQVIQPEVQRRDLKVGKIDTEDFELTGFLGYMNIEDFEGDVVYGARLAYHINEWFFGEVSYGATEAGISSAERVGGGAELLTGSERDYSYYDISLGWNILPGEVFLGPGRALNSAFYLIVGAGSTSFAGDDEFTVNVGFGFKVLTSDAFAVRLEARDYIFDVDVTGKDKTTQNFQATLNASWFF